MAGGPLPKPDGQRRRRNATVAMTRLPAEGRQGDPPPWPLDWGSEDELALWDDLWHTPQAVVWERYRWTRAVARYCTLITLAESGTLTISQQVSVMAEIRQIEDRLGLNPVAMLRLRWEVAPDEVGEARQAQAPRRRLVAVDPTGPTER